MEVIPAVDLYEGKVVRLRQGRLEQKTKYAENPAATAKAFQDQSAAWIHVVDLNAAFSGKPENLDAFKAVREAVDVNLQVGGGIRRLSDAKTWVDAGANRLVLSTLLSEDFSEAQRVADAFPGQVLASIDVRNGEFKVKGWTASAPMPDLLELKKAGFAGLVFTDVSRDGVLSGQTGAFLDGLDVPLPFFVAGGVARLQDIDALKKRGAAGVILGKALYENRFTLGKALEVASC